MDEKEHVKIGISVVPGSHPIPQKYYLMHQTFALGTTVSGMNSHVMSSRMKQYDLNITNQPVTLFM